MRCPERTCSTERYGFYTSIPWPEQSVLFGVIYGCFLKKWTHMPSKLTLVILQCMPIFACLYLLHINTFSHALETKKGQDRSSWILICLLLTRLSNPSHPDSACHPDCFLRYLSCLVPFPLLSLSPVEFFSLWSLTQELGEANTVSI